MKYSFVVASLVASSTALTVPLPDRVNSFSNSVQQVLGSVKEACGLGGPEKFLIELEPGRTEWVTEEQKWDLKRAGKNFMDITSHQTLYTNSRASSKKTVSYPSKIAHNSTVHPLLKELSKERMHEDLEKLTSFYTRYYKSSYGAESSKWLLSHVQDAISEHFSSSGKGKQPTAAHFRHDWGQHSVIARIPGKTEKTVVIGAHQDSINLLLPSLLGAPGADDDGSGTVTILEAFRVLLEAAASGELRNTVEFHWYSAEEGGLLGSQDVFRAYAATRRDVVAMLQQDMTGYAQGTLDNGSPESVGVITDFVDEGLTEFVKKVIVAYCDVPYTLTKCGYACSDHASASKEGYPSAFVIESDFSLSNKRIHTTEDKIKYLSFDHMLQHAKLTLGVAYELGMAKF